MGLELSAKPLIARSPTRTLIEKEKNKVNQTLILNIRDSFKRISSWNNLVIIQWCVLTWRFGNVCMLTCFICHVRKRTCILHCISIRCACSLSFCCYVAYLFESIAGSRLLIFNTGGGAVGDRSPFVNVDTTTVAGIARAKQMGFADSGLAQCVVTPVLW